MAQVEIDPLAICVLAHHFGNGVKRFADIRQFTKTGFPFRDVAGGQLVDILWMSPPCQDHSNQNPKKKSIKGANGKILIDSLDVLSATPIDEIPRVLVCENVLGFNSKIRNSKSPAPITLMQNRLKKIGYQSIAVRTLDASQFGKPAHRKRVFLVASLQPDVAANILFALEVMMECQKCTDSERKCRLCSQAATENRAADSDVVFTASLHNALSLPLINILNTETASSGYRMFAASRGRIGLLSISQRLEAMGFPKDFFDFLQDLSNAPNNKRVSDAAKVRLIGNAMHFDVVKWLLGRIIECLSAPSLPKFDKAVLNDLQRFKCTTETVVKLGGYNWKTGAVPRRCCYDDSDKLSSNLILAAAVGAFEVLNVPNCLPAAAVYVLPDAFFDVGEMLELPIHVLTTYLSRLAIRGHVIAQELLARLLLWSPENSQRILPTICQASISDKMIVGTPCYVFVDDVNRWLPAESFQDKSLSDFGRAFPDDVELEEGEVFCVLAPVTETGWSQVAEILGLGNDWSGYFKVNKDKIVRYGTIAAIQVFTDSRLELAKRENFEDSADWKILSDGFSFISDLEAVLRNEEGSWNCPTMRILRAIASRRAISSSGSTCNKCDGCLSKDKNSSRLLPCRKRRAAVCAGSSGAYASELESRAIGLDVEFWWGDRFLQGKIIDYNERTTAHAIELTVSGEKRMKKKNSKSITQTNTIGHFMLWAPKCCNLEIKVKERKKRVRAPVPAEGHRLALENLGKPDVLSLPEIECKFCRIAVPRIASQSLVNFGKHIKIPGQHGTFINWSSVRNESPVTLWSMIGLVNSRNNKGISKAPLYFYQNVHKCVRRVWLYILDNVAPRGAHIRLSLDFAAPVFSPREIKEIMPVVTSTPGNRCPEYADISIFKKLDDKTKKERRQQFLTLICLSRGALSPCCEQGAVANVTMWINGVKRIVQIELP